MSNARSRAQQARRQRERERRANTFHPPSHYLGPMNSVCPDCGALHWASERTSDSSNSSPRYGACCNSGKVSLPDMQHPPDTLYNLFEQTDPRSNVFLANIRQYNSALAFTSLGVKFDCNVMGQPGGYTFRIQDELHHLSGPLLPGDDQTASYAQLYIYDPQYALDIRMERNIGLDRTLMNDLQSMLISHHPYVSRYRQAFTFLSNQPADANLQLRLHFDPGQDHRRYNLPTSDEIAVILPGDGSPSADHRDIILHLRDDGDYPLQRISELNPAYDTLHYVLFFPHGEHGWHPNIPLSDIAISRRTHPRVSQMQFYAYRLHPRTDEYNTILRGSHLMQQYIVDAWAATDQNRLNYIRYNQKALRAELYGGLVDALMAEDVEDFSQLGQRVILPSSYTGGPRQMHERYQDSMAIARHFGKIDFFITMTANPHWREIMEALLPSQSAYDRPDIVARVFNEKKKAFLHEIVDKKFFGQVVAHVDAIEFQKRGLPHMHLLLWLTDGDKIRDVSQVDRFVCAELPNRVRDQQLWQIITGRMMHGPCGIANPSCPCMKEGLCSKRYPRDFAEVTTMGSDGYPNYRRRNNGFYVEKDHVPLDNRWVVPHNRKLCRIFDCHINVEVCTSVSSVKYIHKYVYKGHDKATLEVGCRDEVKQYLDSRYIGPSEAAWRLFHFHLYEHSPSVTRLHIHLPGQHMVVFDPSNPQNIIADQAGAQKSTLMAFFENNSRQWLYHEYPQHYVYNLSEKSWTFQQRQFAVGRMCYIPPASGELFYLRLLLTVFRGPTSFEDLRSFEGVTYGSFKEVCLARGLLQDDMEWVLCLEEASAMKSGAQLRSLFAMVLLQCAPTDPAALWHRFKPHLCDDVAYRLRNMGFVEPSPETVYDYGLYLLDVLLQQSGHELSDFPAMPKPIRQWHAHHGNRLIAEQLNYDVQLESTHAAHHVSCLNSNQLQAYEEIVDSIDNAKGKMFFIHGPGGAGKTFLYRTVAHQVRSKRRIILIVSATGISSLLLDGGSTAHARFKIPIPVDDLSTCKITGQLADLIRVADGLLWDEVGSQHRHCVEAVNRSLQDVRKDSRPFGGLTVIFGGDFAQTLPVVPRGRREDFVGASLLRSHLWQHLKIFHLRRNMRLENSASSSSFAEWQLSIARGQESSEESLISFPQHMRCGDTIESLISSIYPAISSPVPHDDQYFLQRAILTPLNEGMHDINRHVLHSFPGEEHVFQSADSVQNQHIDSSHYTMEFLNSMCPPGLPLSTLRLKIGCPLIVLRNLSPAQGLCNGTRVRLLRATSRVLEVRILTGRDAGNTAFIPRITLTLDDASVNLSRRQFPVHLAFAMTINKAQGQTLQWVGLDLRMPVFAHGQLYVAISRATRADRVKILFPDSSCITSNIVYPEVMQHFSTNQNIIGDVVAPFPPQSDR